MPNIGYVILEGAPIEAPDVTIVEQNSRRVIGEGEIQTAEEENRNGRCYLNQDLHREINCPRTLELISTGNMGSENGHPMDTSVVRQQVIDPNNVVSIFTKIWMDGDHVMAQFRGSNLAIGEAFDQDLRDGFKPSWSLRALGSLANIRGRNVVQDLHIVTWDRVIYPSHPHAYTQRIVSESAGIDKYAEKEKASKLTKMNESGLLIPIDNPDILSYIKQESATIKSLTDQIDFQYESSKVINNGRDMQLVAKNGDTFIVNLEAQISREIYNYCSKL